LDDWIFFRFFANRKSNAMSRICQLTGKKVMVGNNVSHSKRRTKRTFYPNLQKKRFFNPEDGTYVTLRVSTSAMRTINKIGLRAAIEQSKAKGLFVED
jgi:large subunit ribosomal protein L28